MRIWHYELVRALPDAQLVSQWRELCAIAKRIELYGYPNHLLVNKVMDYSAQELINYADEVIEEMNYRHFRINIMTYNNFIHRLVNSENKFKNIKKSQCGQYKGWHDSRYYWQCFYNLQEKHDCGGLTENEWNRIKRNKKFVMISNIFV